MTCLQSSDGFGSADTSATGHFGTKTLRHQLKPNHRWSCVLSELSWVQSVPTFRMSNDVEVSRTTFLMQKCLETVLKCRCRSEMSWCQSVLWPKCPVIPEFVQFSLRVSTTDVAYTFSLHLSRLQCKEGTEEDAEIETPKAAREEGLGGDTSGRGVPSPAD